jgi:hypothetical protein
MTPGQLRMASTLIRNEFGASGEALQEGDVEEGGEESDDEGHEDG